MALWINSWKCFTFGHCRSEAHNFTTALGLQSKKEATIQIRALAEMQCAQADCG
uniref:Uncharacterized protein n=1 Tax=Anguilla anguilla TaxID=7936 RepID=A0A0E9VI41_ANGAN